jgi:hypothetical protein
MIIEWCARQVNAIGTKPAQQNQRLLNPLINW